MFLQVLIVLLISKDALANTSSICASVPHGNYVRSSQSCNSFNRCMNGQPIHGICPKGFSFSPKSQMCDYNIDVDCRLCSPFGIQNIPEPDNCNMYYRCVNGVRSVVICANGLLFDRYFGDCNVAERVICETRNSICEPFKSLGTVLIGNPLDCSSYYYCINGRAIEAICNNGLFYNAHTATCEVRGNTNFCQGIGPIITTPRPVVTTDSSWTTQSTTKTTVRVIYIPTVTGAPTTQTTTQVANTTITASTTTVSTTITTTEAATEETTMEDTTTTIITTTLAPELLCTEGNHRGHYLPYPSPDNCTRYYYCFNDRVTYTYVCNPGLFFTPGGNQCTENVPPGCEHLVSEPANLFDS